MSSSEVILERIGSGELGEDSPAVDEIEVLRTKISSIEKQVKELKQENRTLLLQLHRSEGELHSFLSGKAALGSSVKVTKKKAAAKRKDGLLRIFVSKAFRRVSAGLKKVVNPKNAALWLLTAPLRSVSRPVRLRLSRFVHG